MRRISTKKTICFDIDGTICEQTRGEYEFARPFPEAKKIVNKLYEEGFKIIFFTARYMGRYNGDREKTYQMGYQMTYRQLKKWGFKFHELHLGKPPHHIMVDDKALFFNPSWTKIYREIKKKENLDIY
ncbi:MAG: phosphoheptose isomerase [Deltaproteobacteria bacterium]|nr:phosphoheptose isomerase [Deltaproteobacteria bacterium]